MSSFNKAVLITGANSGIGAATAKLFSENGYFVFLLARDQSKLNTVINECKNPKATMALVCDLADIEQINEAVSVVESKLKEAQLQFVSLINNAGIFHVESFVTTSLEVWTQQFQVNLLSIVALSQKLIPLLNQSNGASIVNVSSTLGLRTVPMTSSYSAIKAALISLTETMALELAPQIRVNCIAPGLVDTPIHAFHSLTLTEKQKSLQELAGRQPMNRVGTAEEIAESILFLASEKSKWTTGAILSVDGGINIK